MNAPSKHLANRLAGESSSYLLQHAHQPVDWYPWGDAALQLARAENKPILLSIGYSACHWCHVMAHESFDDPAIAAVMNQWFVNIKVDREERPDLDRIYQLAHQLLLQRSGGWPLTMFLTPHEQQPFFGGTYFPRQAQHGLPGFEALLERVAGFYHTRGAEIAQQGTALQRALQTLLPQASPPGALDHQPLAAAREALASAFDPDCGGFGAAPKFPHTSNLELLLRIWRATAATESPDLHSLYMVSLSLTRMAEGGIYDQLGGGFARYSVDRCWHIPHFEKMLYDNVQLLSIYAQAAIATGEPLFARVAGETADWLLRDLQAPQGGFFASLDADSEGSEGRFYVWDREQVRAMLPAAQYDSFARRFGLEQPANFEAQWHLRVHTGLPELAAALNQPIAMVEQQLQAARTTLLEARQARVAPQRDAKILTAWNALAAGSLAQAARCLQRPDLAAAAQATVDFLRAHLWREGRLLAVHAQGRSYLAGYLDDHAFLLHALLELLQTRWRTSDLWFAIELAELLLRHFEDADGGGFFFTADDHEPLLHRPKSFADEALPGGAALAALGLQRLGALLAESRYLTAAARTLNAGLPLLQRYPHAHASLLLALDEHIEPPQVIIIRGEHAESSQWRDTLAGIYAPRRQVFAIDCDAAQLPQALLAKHWPGTTVAYVCQGTKCSQPIDSLAALTALTRG
jgi:uncharacterized protein YyaL (SSP411 family)